MTRLTGLSAAPIMWRFSGMESCAMFEDIRPYNNSEVRGVIERLVGDDELAIAVRHLAFPRLSPMLDPVSLPLLKTYLGFRARKVRNVEDFQELVKDYFKLSTDRSCTNFAVQGLEHVPREKACLYISNHRDIALDPAFVNLALYGDGLNTCQIAIGDNLLSKPYVSDLLRLNKCFIVKRSLPSSRQLLRAMRTLSGYINITLQSQTDSIWLAQREGRAKNGDDRTEPAVLKMLHMAPRGEGIAFCDAMQQLSIVPVSISYEFDPCDVLKAKELQVLRDGGDYSKTEHEDVESIARGITGYKGDVSVSFSEPLHINSDSPDDLAEAIDQRILKAYQLHASNIYAYRQLEGEVPDEFVHISSESARLKEHLAKQIVPVQEILLDMYARPVYNKLALLRSA